MYNIAQETRYRLSVPSRDMQERLACFAAGPYRHDSASPMKPRTTLGISRSFVPAP